jgi:mRNA interferase HigB
MHVIARPALDAAGREYPLAAQWLRAWWAIASQADWRQLTDVRRQYPSADQVDCCLIFDVGGNKYRLICRVSWHNDWTRGTLLVKHFLTHAEYDRNKWRKDCR